MGQAPCRTLGNNFGDAFEACVREARVGNVLSALSELLLESH